jgi:hypothetical protein
VPDANHGVTSYDGDKSKEITVYDYTGNNTFTHSNTGKEPHSIMYGPKDNPSYYRVEPNHMAYLHPGLDGGSVVRDWAVTPEYVSDKNMVKVNSKTATREKNAKEMKKLQQYGDQTFVGQHIGFT